MIYFHDANEPTDDDEECKASSGSTFPLQGRRSHCLSWLCCLLQLPMHERRLIIDIAGDIRRLNDIAQFAQQTGILHSYNNINCFGVNLTSVLCLVLTTRYAHPWWRSSQASHLQR